MIVEHPGATPLTPDMIARALGVSRRTFNRRLAEEDTSSATSSTMCGVSLPPPCCSIAPEASRDVAFFLQYSEPAAFNRWFRRWTGRTPGEFRNAQAMA
jgi:AraC-like DNA-binding protein